MSRVQVETVDTAPASVQNELKALEQQFGKVLNIHGAMASSPVALKAYVALQEVIQEHGTFDAKTREAIALAVGNVDECTYCQSAHTQGAKGAGFSEDETVAIRKGTVDFDDTLAALLQVTREAAADKGNVKDSSWQAALDAGWSAEQLTELSTHLALNLYTNHFNHMVETDLDVPAAQLTAPTGIDVAMNISGLNADHCPVHNLRGSEVLVVQR